MPEKQSPTQADEAHHGQRSGPDQRQYRACAPPVTASHSVSRSRGIRVDQRPSPTRPTVMDDIKNRMTIPAHAAPPGRCCSK